METSTPPVLGKETTVALFYPCASLRFPSRTFETLTLRPLLFARHVIVSSGEERKANSE
jgi:hypothetical protein